MNNNNSSHIEVKSDGFITEVFVDGKRLENVVGISMEQRAGDEMHVSLELRDDKIDLDTRLIPDLPDIYKPFYQKKEPQDSDS